MMCLSDRSTSTGTLSDRSTFTSTNACMTNLRHCLFLEVLLSSRGVCLQELKLFPPLSFQQDC